ncbi:MAG: S9 family peptidase, partial [Betaproteobacteria bacterium]|nr:S9 family peptidase [Betaproteobacteria bacterium]
GLARLDVATILFNPGSPWMIARTTDTTLPEGFLFVAPVKDLGKPDIVWKKISGYEDKISDVALKGDDLYFLTHFNAPQKQVMKLNLRNPDLKQAVVVAAPPKEAVLEDFNLLQDGLMASIRVGTDIVLRRYRSGDTAGEAIAMPFKGAAAVHNEPAHASNEVLYTLSGWTQLPRTFLLKGNASADAGLRVNPPLPKLPDVEVAEVTVSSHDGAKVPMTLLYKKGLKRDGSNPTLLNAYAAYGFSETAGFSAANMVWLEQGGVLAFANVRGSGVYGDTWYRGGFKATKSNTWKDGVACAKFLIAEGYASPKTLAVSGTSAGGIFVGRTVTSAPELFAAAIFNVGLMDAVRAEESANGITNISEFGSTKNAAEFPALLEMSTYHNIKDNVAYPAVMLVHGINDPRVDVWHSAKVAARLQAASNSGKPTLLRLDLQAGHGVGSTATQRYAQSADIFSFLLWQMGKASLKN